MTLDHIAPLVAPYAPHIAVVAALPFILLYLWVQRDSIVPFLRFCWELGGFVLLLALICACGIALASTPEQVGWEGMAPGLMLTVFTLPGHAANLWKSNMGW